MTGTPGDVLRNMHFSDRFTCPECLVDHEVQGVGPSHSGEDRVKFIDCECGARLRLSVEMTPEAVCTIADPDEETEED